jgi:general secretion pathway protein G
LRKLQDHFPAHSENASDENLDRSPALEPRAPHSRTRLQLGSAKHKIAEQSIERLSGVLDLYRLDVGSYPTTAQGLAALNDNSGNVTGWNGPYLKDAQGIVDPWGHPFQYRNPSERPKHSFDIISLGADGKSGGEGEDADIINR